MKKQTEEFKKLLDRLATRIDSTEDPLKAEILEGLKAMRKNLKAWVKYLEENT
jgi:hypothetical protein